MFVNKGISNKAISMIFTFAIFKFGKRKNYAKVTQTECKKAYLVNKNLDAITTLKNIYYNKNYIF